MKKTTKTNPPKTTKRGTNIKPSSPRTPKSPPKPNPKPKGK